MLKNDDTENLLPMPLPSRGIYPQIRRHACYEERRWAARCRVAHDAFSGLLLEIVGGGLSCMVG